MLTVMVPNPEETRITDSAVAAGIALAPGTVLRGRYRLDAELGRGGMGIVFRATDIELGREVAIKVLPETVSIPGARGRLLSEARAAAALNHPRVVAVYDVGEEHGVPFFVMELVLGASLRQLAPQDLPDIIEIGCQICEALEHAHDHHLVHRDLKPENVLLVESAGRWSIKLADLGIALPMRDSSQTQIGGIAGTVGYMAPEQALGRPIDGRADLYALGAVLYELTTGRPPFQGDDPLAVISQHVHAPVVPPRAIRPDLPAAIESVILRLLAKDPEQRYATAVEAAAALRYAVAAPADADVQDTGAVALLDALSRGRLVGRARELGEARDLWRRALDRRGHCLLVSGEPGAGKTRLARELLIQGALDGAIVMTGGCYEYEAATPYLPLVEAFRRWVRDTEDDEKLRQLLGDNAPQIAKLAPDVEARLGPFPDRPQLPPQEERLLFFDAVVQVLRELSTKRGLLLYIDDLHWADGGTLWLLSHLLRNLKEERVLVAASYRETELDRSHPLSKSLVDWNRERLTTRIALRRFALEETRAQLGALLGEETSLEFAAAVHKETEGNPFFVEEVLKSLIEQGAVRRAEGKWTRDEITELSIPQSMKAAIGSRLDRVSPECNEVLRAAAVVGKIFDFEKLVVAAGDRGEEALLDALDEASAAQLIVAERNDTFTFTHDKIREVLYEEMNPVRRRRLHMRTAEGLERLRNRMPVPAESLAHHYIQGGDHRRGLIFAREAAGEAERVFAYDEAIAAYTRALECAEVLGLSDERIALEESIGRALILRGDLLGSCEHFERALALVTEPRHRARLQSMAATALVTNADPRGLAYIQQALEVLDPKTEPFEVANALTVAGRFHHLAGRHRQAIELMEQAAALAAPAPEREQIDLGQAAALIQTYAYLAGAHQHLGLFADGDRWARSAIELGERFGIPFAAAVGHEFLGEDAISTGEWREGLAHADREREIAGQLHSRERLAWSCMYGGICAALLGDAERAGRELLEGLALANAIDERRLACLLTCSLGTGLAALGRMDEAEDVARQALERAEALNLDHMRAEAWRCMAHVRIQQGRLEEALRLFEQILATLAESEAKVSRLWIGPPHIETLLALGRTDEAREVLRAYGEMVAQCQTAHFAREVVRLRGLVEGGTSPS
jgi:eukaryotic-like serine/threonine-protein kinase